VDERGQRANHAPSQPVGDPAVEYARRLYDRIISWYESAERKAQLILTLDGVFLSFLVGSLLAAPDDLDPILAEFGWETWTLALTMAGALVGSIACAVLCLTSRLMSTQDVKEEYHAGRVAIGDSDTYRPEVMWYFQLVAGLSREEFAERVVAMDAEHETVALADSSVMLAKNVVSKHRWVNRGFVLVGVVLVLFLATGISYVVRVA
jgi:hypothetical protein